MAGRVLLDSDVMPLEAVYTRVDFTPIRIALNNTTTFEWYRFDAIRPFPSPDPSVALSSMKCSASTWKVSMVVD
jgi:hypothetical protein